MIKENNSSIAFMFGSLSAKVLAACVQLYAIFIFTKVHIADEASIIFLLLGYGIWFQIFECGLSQTLQNRLNSKKSVLVDAFFVISAHYFFMLVLAVFILLSDTIPNLLLPTEKYFPNSSEFKAFSIGMALMAISISNVVIQRLLLVLNKGFLANIYLIAQSILIILGLLIYWLCGEINLISSVILYFGPQVLIYIPLMMKIIHKVFRKYKYSRESLRNILSDAGGFWLISLLATIFLGADYYFAAHYLSSGQIGSYHITSRFFFLSFVAYYSYLQHGARFIKTSSDLSDLSEVQMIVKKSIFIGITSVILVLLFIITSDFLGLLNYFIGQYQINIFLLFSAGIYFLIRVFRDVGVVILGNMGKKYLLYKVYFVEMVLGFFLLNFSISYHSGVAIFAAMAGTCFFSACLIYKHINQLMRASN